MAGVRHKSVQFLFQSSSPLFRYHITLNAIRPRAIQLPRLWPLQHVIVSYLSNGRVRSHSTVQPDDPTPAQNEINKSDLGSRVVSESGRRYSIEYVLQEKDHRPERVYLASYVIEHSISSLSPVIQ
jgi:hypothetical protein